MSPRRIELYDEVEISNKLKDISNEAVELSYLSARRASTEHRKVIGLVHAYVPNCDGLIWIVQLPSGPLAAYHESELTIIN